jgi:hypothetical protein
MWLRRPNLYVSCSVKIEEGTTLCSEYEAHDEREGERHGNAARTDMVKSLCHMGVSMTDEIIFETAAVLCKMLGYFSCL